MMATVQAFGQAELQGLFAALKVLPHPMLKLPTLEWVQALIAARPDGSWKAELVTFLNRRNERIRLAEEDPLWFGWEFEPWKDADDLLNGVYVAPGRGEGVLSRDDSPSPRPSPQGEGELSPGQQRNNGEGYKPAEASILGIFGGNRASKTVYAVRRACQTAWLFAGSRIALCSESVTASIATLEAQVWYYFKPHVGHLNGRRNEVEKVNYTQANGFSNRKLVLPNGSEIYFLTYGQEPGDYEGWEFGAPAHLYETLSREIREGSSASSIPPLHGAGTPQRSVPTGFVPPNIGAVCDESMPLAWLKMFSRRLKFRRAKLLWPFTPVKGITPAIKELTGAATTVESRPAELLPRQNFPDIPKGHMPYIKECGGSATGQGVKVAAIYFFTEFNKFGPAPDRTYYEEVKALCDGKTSEYVERVAYGVARDTVARAFPKFGPWNIVKRSQLPSKRTNYFFTDPAGARNWATFWVGVTANGDHYIYRDWPDAQTYGEWAVPTEREVNDQNRSGWDGDPGPAQVGMGFGIVKYKQTFLNAEAVCTAATMPETDPYRGKLIERARAQRNELGIYEEIAERYVDPRAGASEHIAEKGGTCITEEFEDVQFDSTGKVTGPSMELIPASGVNEDEGLTAVNDLLDWNQEQPLMPILNAPRLYVCEDAMQVIWCLENFTGRAGAKGAAKDFADLLRYMALAKLTYVDGQASGRKGGGF